MSVEAELAVFIVDCADPERLGAFWSQLLDREVGGRIGPYVFLKRARPDEIGIGFQRVAEPRMGKNRVHPDLNCGDVHEVAARVVELGGSRVSGYESGGFLVMADPEGNEFCLLPKYSSARVDEHGNAHYLEAGESI